MKVQIGGWDQIKHIYDLLDEEERKKGRKGNGYQQVKEMVIEIWYNYEAYYKLKLYIFVLYYQLQCTI